MYYVSNNKALFKKKELNFTNDQDLGVYQKFIFADEMYFNFSWEVIFADLAKNLEIREIEYP